jgi:hypothetical protein
MPLNLFARNITPSKSEDSASVLTSLNIPIPVKVTKEEYIQKTYAEDALKNNRIIPSSNPPVHDLEKRVKP